MVSVNRRILIVDDNADIHRDFEKILQGSKKREVRHQLSVIEEQLFADENDEDGDEGFFELAQVEYDMDSAFQGEEAVALVSKAYEEGQPYSLVFMDVRMPPGIDGIEAILRIWKKHAEVQIVICTAYSDYSFDGIIEKLGTTDRLLFLTKPFDSIAVKQMALSLSHKWSLHREALRHVDLLEKEIRQRKASEARLHHMVHHDPLTDLANRQQLQVSLEAAIERAKNSRTRFALFLLELDRFNEVIDTLGYQIGDRLIVEVARRLTQEFAPRGEVFRHGDNEFSLIIREMASIEHLNREAHRIQAAFQSNFELDELNIEINPNIGIVIYPDHGSSFDMLMRHADMTLLSVKKAGHGFRFYDESMNLFNHQRLTLLTHLRKAIQDEDLILYFQPKIDLKTNRLVAVESLIRWPHSQYGFVSPSKFIPLAERCGVIKHVTSWLLGEASKQWAQWAAMGLDLTIGINLTTIDLQDPQLPDKIRRAQEPYGMPADRLCIEISEKRVMEDPEQVTHTLNAIKDMGVMTAIDDFGTGHSSLSYLKTLPVQEIKIHSSFVKELKANSNEEAIVRSMIELGHNLGLSVAAIGVNSEQSAQLLAAFGCDYLQGEVINQPAPAGEFLIWLKGGKWGAPETA